MLIKPTLIVFSYFLYSSSLLLIVNSAKPVNHWSVNRWYIENKDYDHNPINLRFTDSSLKSGHAFLNARSGGFLKGQNPTNPEFNEISFTPQASAKKIRKTLSKFFAKTRSYMGDRDYYEKVKTLLKQQFVSMGLKTALQSFWPPEMEQVVKGDKAHNIIGVWPGAHRGTENDRIIIVGAHYDSVPEAPGVDDNGSGSAAVFEMAKLITQSKCKFEKTIMFVLFDLEEDGLKGSKHFVKDYLIPIEIEQNGAQVVGAIILDMVLAYNRTNNSQTVEGFEFSTELSKIVEQNNFRGDFVAVEARTDLDAVLYKALRKNWRRSEEYRLAIMDVPLPRLAEDLDFSKHEKFSDFLRSDHVSFWYTTRENITISSIMINDLGPWRASMVNQYHQLSDDMRSVTDESLDFLKNTVDSVVATLLDLANGVCFQTKS